MDTTLTQKFPFILDRNLAKANCTENHVCTSCDKVVLGVYIYAFSLFLLCITDDGQSARNVLWNKGVQFLK